MSAGYRAYTWRLGLALMSSIMLAGCDAPTGDKSPEPPAPGANGRRDLTGTGVDMNGERNGESYERYDAFRDQNGTGLAFAGYGCLSNCADVISGYRRAQQQKIADARLCAAPTWGEQEGCVAFAQGLPSELSSLPPLKEEAKR